MQSVQWSDELLVADEPSAQVLYVAQILVKHAGSARQTSWRDPHGLRIPGRTQAQAEATLRELRQRLILLTGEARAQRFSEIARKSSDCGSARYGGHLGQSESLDPATQEESEIDESGYQAAVSKLSNWEMSDIVETELGSHLFIRLPESYDASPRLASPVSPADPPNIVLDARGEPVGEEAPDSARPPPTTRTPMPRKPTPAKPHPGQKYTAALLPKHLAKLQGSALRQQEDAQMRRLFNRADVDGSGTLQLKEIKQLCKDLGDRISTAALEEGFYRMDPEKTGVVNFESFRKWWRLKEDTARREMRKNVAEIFAMVDADSSGTLDRGEINLVAEKIAKKYSGAEFSPPFDPDIDYPAMDATGKGYATFAEFAAWFKVRSGDTDAEIPVLPEYMVEKVKTLSDKDDLKGRSSKELWQFLRHRLSVIVNLQRQWGRVQDLYGTGGKLFDSQSIPDGVFDPDSSFMKYWDVFQFFALVRLTSTFLPCHSFSHTNLKSPCAEQTYIMLIMPVRVGFSVEVPLLSFPFFVDVIIDVYFIVDIYLNFKTAQWLPSGALETNPKNIRRSYLKGWFSVDFISSFPVTYVMLAARLMQGDTRGERNGYQRLLRLVKLARFTRLRAVLKKYEDNGVIGDVTPYLGTIGTLATIVISGHILTCLWFYFGNAYGSIDCDPTHEYADILGRIGDAECVAKEGGGHHFPVSGWVIRQDYPEATSLGTKYIDAMYSVFKSKFAYTGSEMKVGIMSELVLGLIFGSLAGVISAIMVTLGAGEQDAMAKTLQLRAWMRARDIKSSDRVKILAAFNSQQELAGFDQADILRDLPPSLSSDISFFMYGKYIERIPIFRHLGQEVIAETCKWVRNVSLPREQIVYQEAKYGTEMYFIVSGEVEVSCDSERLGFLSEGAFFGEGPLIASISGTGGTGSSIRTRTVRTLCRCDFGVLRREDVSSIMSLYPELKVRLRNFNLVGKHFSSKGRKKQSVQELKSAVLQTVHAANNAETLLPPSHVSVTPTIAPQEGTLDEDTGQTAVLAETEREVAALRAEVAALRSALVARASPPPAASEDLSVAQAAAAVLQIQSQVMKAHADLLRACAYSPAAADAALKAQSSGTTATGSTSTVTPADSVSGRASGTNGAKSHAESMWAETPPAPLSGTNTPPVAQPLADEAVDTEPRTRRQTDTAIDTEADTATERDRTQTVPPAVTPWPDSAETLRTKRDEAIVLKQAGNHSSAQSLLEDVVASLTEQLGATHLATLETQCDLASSLRVTGAQARAQELYEGAVAAQSVALGAAHVMTLATRFNLASMLDEMGERERARDIYEEVVQGQTEALGASHRETLDTMYHLADLLESQPFSEFSRARELFGTVAAGYAQVYGPEHAETLDAKERLRRANFKILRHGLSSKSAYF